MTINRNTSVIDFLRESTKDPDGKAWILIMVCCVLFAFDLLTGLNIIPLRDAARQGKAYVLLGFSPIITFLFLILFRQLFFSKKKYIAYARAVLLIFTFILINF